MESLKTPSEFKINNKKSFFWPRTIKIIILLFFPFLSLTLLLISTDKNLFKKKLTKKKDIIVSVSMKNTNWKGLGSVFEPLITIPIKTSTGYKPNQFLLDSGAVISSLPREWAEKTNQDLSFLKRSTFYGYGNKKSFAYEGKITALIGKKEFILPVVFTEGAGTTSLLGRKGFFENYSIYFNHKEKKIEIRN